MSVELKVIRFESNDQGSYIIGYEAEYNGKKNLFHAEIPVTEFTNSTELLIQSGVSQIQSAVNNWAITANDTPIGQVINLPIGESNSDQGSIIL
jgi:hypothetical protein